VRKIGVEDRGNYHGRGPQETAQAAARHDELTQVAEGRELARVSLEASLHLRWIGDRPFRRVMGLGTVVDRSQTEGIVPALSG
jgi:hypothetical protein